MLDRGSAVFYNISIMKDTAALDGYQASKDSALVRLIGTVDELNSHLGLVKTLLPDEETRQFLEQVQKTLMKVMSHAFDAGNERYLLNEDDVACLRNETGRLSAALPKLTGFVLPGHNTTEAHIHIARTVARRAERCFAAVSGNQPLCEYAGAYLNKLSDYLFALSLENKAA